MYLIKYQISATTDFYGIHERYPITVRTLHGLHTRTGLKRTARNAIAHIGHKFNRTHDLLNDEGKKVTFFMLSLNHIGSLLYLLDDIVGKRWELFLLHYLTESIDDSFIWNLLMIKSACFLLMSQFI
ncbi:uncharacterized protein LOC116347258 isoform X2 [Contarinia nasturtii]|uniref:uncharacterized protein LOC116347258 isoform X2 n=1 Tax=Contarinia nasturtii TaxID=265458 RepID=UPI0012D477FA|nr:uncharacterized protein LOC116347258 isoform X2 [Contarinia nasturtii]XP_031633649.1 uncharacterized protein LOC116347258 isoform X2 [Contarinia nasturtii]XP_031633650.1 uncharacterized protein LOC116347258 isoform X2 [Contarinia nasturtii]